MIRYFENEDCEAIYNLGNEISNNFSKTNDLKSILNDKYTKILVYENDNEIIGFLMYTELTDVVDILNIIVKKEYRNQTIASCLFDYMMDEINCSVKLITLEVRKSNQPAINFYKKFGFEIINIRKQYYENEDAYLMGRSLK